MSENEEFDVSLLDELKPLDCFLENELEKRSTSDESIGHEEALELDFLEDFVVNSEWPLEKRILEVSPSARVRNDPKIVLLRRAFMYCLASTFFLSQNLLKLEALTFISYKI